MKRWFVAATLGLVAGFAAACQDASNPVAPSESAVSPVQTSSHVASTVRAGAVYLMTNADGPNEVLVFRRGSDGSLTADDPVATGGSGTGMGLGNQDAVQLTKDGRWLLVVNPGSNDVSLFAVTPHGLRLSDRASSGGSLPISVAVHDRLVYVLNAGSPNSISGLWIGHGGKLLPMPGSTRPLSGAMVGPAQVSFSPNGRVLVVTEKGTNSITTYKVYRNGWASAPRTYPSAGPTPFGFAFDNRGRLIVSEAAGGAADASSVSSYQVRWNGSLRLLDGSVPTMQTAACWIAVSPNGLFAYTTNAGSGSVAGLRIDHAGRLQLLDADGRTGVTGDGSVPLDAAFSSGGRYLYILSSGIPAVSIFSVDGHGALTSLGNVPVPAGANGLAVQ